MIFSIAVLVFLVFGCPIVNFFCWLFIWHRDPFCCHDPFNWRALIYPRLYADWLDRR